MKLFFPSLMSVPQCLHLRKSNRLHLITVPLDFPHIIIIILHFKARLPNSPPPLLKTVQIFLYTNPD